jgi:hypothetical protein
VWSLYFVENGLKCRFRGEIWRVFSLGSGRVVVYIVKFDRNGLVWLQEHCSYLISWYFGSQALYELYQVVIEDFTGITEY